ncbi:MAG: PIN domain-containing protein [Dehalococcoidia bacterium]|nr:PIN domain-containing protein [Dehalococcoidia bacterium]
MSDGVLDTTFFIDLRRGQNQGALAMWSDIQNGHFRAAVSSVTYLELWMGPHLDREEELFYEGVLDLEDQVHLSTVAAKLAGAWLRTLRPEFSERLVRDALIAASAFERGEAVYTANRRDFGRFPIEIRNY